VFGPSPPLSASVPLLTLSAPSFSSGTPRVAVPVLVVRLIVPWLLQSPPPSLNEPVSAVTLSTSPEPMLRKPPPVPPTEIGPALHVVVVVPRSAVVPRLRTAPF
jgi:hypothetical protein